MAILLGAWWGTGCETLPPGAERGPNGTMAYEVLIETSPPGARIEANGESVGEAPVRLKIFGDPNGTFHDFGSDYYVIRALPVSTNQFAQIRFFGTGHFFGPEDRIPQKLYFDMTRREPNYPPPGPGYGYPPYGPPAFYGPPPYYGRPYHYYSPGPTFYFGPSHYHHHHRGR